MNRSFLGYYNTELQHIRHMAGEFAREYPKVASRLAIDQEGKEACPDPFVERLLEGFAYLTARVQFKLDEEFPRFTQSLLETVSPHYVAPTPSMAVAELEPDHSNKLLTRGFLVRRGTTLRLGSGREGVTNCTFRTAHDVKLWPVHLESARYLDRSANALALPGHFEAAAVLLLRIGATTETALAGLPIDELVFYLRGSEGLPSAILEQVITHGEGVCLRDVPDAGGPEATWHCLPGRSFGVAGLGAHESLLPGCASSFEGYRILAEYFAFPQRFNFLRLSQMGEAVSRLTGRCMEIAIPLAHAEARLAPLVSARSLALNCTPVVNLFEKRADRIPLRHNASEYQIVVDRTRPLDFEVHSVLSVTGYRESGGTGQPFSPFYFHSRSPHGSPAYFTVHRRPRVLSENEKLFGSLSSYAGSEAFLSLVDTECAPTQPDMDQLGVSVLCTNRHLAGSLLLGGQAQSFEVEINGPVRAARCITGPTPPRPSSAMGETAWRLISHLSLNYFSITDSGSGSGAGALRDLLRLYCDTTDRAAAKQIDGIVAVQSRPVMRRLTTPGTITFARGLEIEVTLDEDLFAGSGIFLLGMVLRSFFARHAAINTFTETVVRSQQRGEIIRWPAHDGKRPIL